MTLAQYGEFRILRDIVHPALRGVSPKEGLGDDCGCVTLQSTGLDLVVTTDAVPKPAVWHLGHNSYHTWGWYSVVINLSDLAAAGADPLLFVTCVDAPDSMGASDFEEFFLGMAEACETFGVLNAGGNIRSADSFSACGTAVGVIRSGSQIRRGGCKPEDLIVCVGTCGAFSSAYIRAKAIGLRCASDHDRTCLLRPKPRIQEMRILRDAGVVSAASDNSDGVLGTLSNIAEASKCAIHLTLSDDSIPPDVRSIALEYGYDPWNLFFCWGDWQVVAAISSTKLAEFSDLARKHTIPFIPLGRAVAGAPAIYAVTDGLTRPVRVLRNESFSQSSFTRDPEAQLNRMLNESIVGDHA
jgi:thiamine-monophosphate kinase